MEKLQDMTTSTQSSLRQTQSLQQPSCSHVLQLYGREGKCQVTGQRESSSAHQRMERSATATTGAELHCCLPSKIHAKIIFKRISDALDAGLRNEEAGFWRERGYTNQIFTLRIIIEQCTEWQRQLYISFVDFEKAFDRNHGDSLWHILRAYGISLRIVQIIKSFYHNFPCSVGSSTPELPSPDRRTSGMCHVCSPF